MKDKKLLNKIYSIADKLDGKLKDLTILCDDIKDLVGDLEEGRENLSKKKVKSKIEKWEGNL